MSSIENKGKVIYLDNAATTKMSEEVKEAMDPYLEEKFGNASTMYGYGETSRQALRKGKENNCRYTGGKTVRNFFYIRWFGVGQLGSKMYCRRV